MKIIRMFSGKEHLVENEEAEGVSNLKGTGVLAELRSGAEINPNGIESITSPEHEKVATLDGYLFNEQNNSYVNDNGNRIFMSDASRLKDIKYIDNPKYNNLKQIK